VLKVGFHNPDFPDGVMFDIGGISVPNNGSTELDHQQELQFYARNAQNVRDYYKDNDYVTIEGKTELSTADKKGYPAEIVEESGEAPSETVVELVDEEGNPVEPEVAVSGSPDDEAKEGSES